MVRVSIVRSSNLGLGILVTIVEFRSTSCMVPPRLGRLLSLALAGPNIEGLQSRYLSPGVLSSQRSQHWHSWLAMIHLRV